MKAISVESVREEGWLLFECLSGSRAYGTDLETSDSDYKGVFVLPQEQFFGLGQIDQVSDDSQDVTFYEVGRFAELLGKNNPNLLEMVFSDEGSRVHSNPLFERFRPELVLSKLCKDTFAGFAMGQIRKARGLNKKIVNPMKRERKSAMDFCYVLKGQGSVPLREWLEAKGIAQSSCGLVNVPHMRDTFGVYFDEENPELYRGIFSSDDATDIRCSGVEIGCDPVGWMTFNRDGFKKYAKEYRSYWEWVENRNEARYATNVEHGRNYDSKNMMHTFRLLDMAEEIARDQTLTVRRSNREELLEIRRGEFEYDDLVKRAEERLVEIDKAFERSALPDRPDLEGIEKALVEVRTEWYEGC